MGGLMMMNSENKYKNLTEKELRRLIKDDDDDALDEFLRRRETGEIKKVTYTLEDLDRMIEEVRARKKAS